MKLKTKQCTTAKNRNLTVPLFLITNSMNRVRRFNEIRFFSKYHFESILFREPSHIFEQSRTEEFAAR